MPVLAVKIDGREFQVELPGVFSHQETLVVHVDGEPFTVALKDTHRADLPLALVDGRPSIVNSDPDLRWLETSLGLHRIEIRDMQAAVLRPASGDGRIKAPIPGLISRIQVSEGHTVEAGQPLLTLEAMKMQNEIRAPFAGTVRALPVSEGQIVARAQVLIEIE